MAVWKKVLLEGTDLATSDVASNFINVSDGTTNTDITLGSAITFAATGSASVDESSGTITIGSTGEANEFSFKTISISGMDAAQSDIVADSTTDTLNLTAQNGVISLTNGSTSSGANDNLQVGIINGGIGTTQLADDSVTTAKINTQAVTFNKLGTGMVIDSSDNSGSGIVDDGTGDDDSHIATVKAITDYVTSAVAASGVTSFTAGDGLTEDGNDTTGELTVNLDAALTTVTSVKNAALLVGRDNDNLIDFASVDNNVIFKVGGANQVKMTDGTFEPNSNNDVDLGTSSRSFKDSFFAGTTTTDTLAVGANATVGGNLTVDGNLQVDGTQTILNTETLTVDDDIIVINDNAAQITAQGGFELKTNTSTKSAILWNAAAGTKLTGWVASPSGAANDLTNYISVMEFSDNSTAPTSGDNAAGVGSFHYDTGNDKLYIRTS